ncbi:MAG: acyl-CoA thioesterase [Lachnospiraceae bacterium]|jgi:acyl-CoA hydrolase|nr:acyl-CoA thioesterase [Lachnospiraceae bacterium]
MKKIKKVSDSITETVHVVRSTHINGVGRLFGGSLMQWIDEISGVVAVRHTGLGVTTAAIDNLNFKEGAYQNDTIVLIGKVTYVGHTSLEVKVDAFVEDKEGNRKNINSAYVVMVAIDDDGKPLEVPGLDIETEEERLEWEAGEKRYNLRKKRYKEGF